MTIGKIQVSNNRAVVVYRHGVTSGTVGAAVEILYDESWDGMRKTLVWCGSGVVKDDTTASGIVPWEVVAKPGSRLKVGVYGVKGNTVTTTVWADLGIILPGADPSGDESADPSLPVWAQIQNQVDGQEIVEIVCEEV